MNDKQVIAFLRGRAAALLAAADALEGKSPVVTSGRANNDSDFTSITGEASAETIQAYVTKKKARPKDLALFFNCPESHIRKLACEYGSGLAVNDRGWIVLDPSNDI